MRNLTNDELRKYNQSLDKIFTPHKPTQEELEDIFTSYQEINNSNRRTSVDYTYAISVLRTDYEKLEDRLYEEERNEVIGKLNELNKAIEALKGDEYVR